MKKNTAWLFVLLPASALFAQGPRLGGPGGPGGPGGAMGRGPGLPGGGAVVTGAPYSAVEVVQSSETLGDGNVIQRKRSTNVFRDSSGRVRTEETITPDASTGKAPFTRVTILDYVGGKRYELDSSTMIAHESPLHAPPARPASATPGTGGPLGRRGAGTAPAGTTGSGLRPSVVRTDLTPQSVNGVVAAGTQHTETIPAGAIGNARPIQTSRITWVSNELKVPVRIQSNDPRFGSTDMELTNISQGEPSASLFVVPAGYTVKTGGPGFGGPRGGPGGGGRSGRSAWAESWISARASSGVRFKAGQSGFTSEVHFNRLHLSMAPVLVIGEATGGAGGVHLAEPPFPQSQRSAFTGSTRRARRAGTVIVGGDQPPLRRNHSETIEEVA